MAEGAEDLLAKARQRAELALEANVRACFKATAVSFVAGTGTLGLLALGLLQTNQVGAAGFWWILGLVAVASGPGALLFFHFSQLYEKSDALRGLLGAQKNYEALLEKVRRDRDDYQSQAVGLMHENAGLRGALKSVVEIQQGVRDGDH